MRQITQATRHFINTTTWTLDEVANALTIYPESIRSKSDGKTLFCVHLDNITCASEALLWIARVARESWCDVIYLADFVRCLDCIYDLEEEAAKCLPKTKSLPVTDIEEV